MRNVMITTMDEDYVLIAQAKGLPKRRVIWYAARNAILPSVSGFSLAIGFVVSGALLTEIVFSYPGSASSCSRRSEAGLRAAPGHLPDHHVGRAGRQPGRRLRLRVPRPAHPAGGLSDGHRQQHGPGRYRPRRPGRRPIRPGRRARTGPCRPRSRPDRGRRIRLPRSPKVLTGLGMLAVFLILAIIGPIVAPTTRPQLLHHRRLPAAAVRRALARHHPAAAGRVLPAAGGRPEHDPGRVRGRASGHRAVGRDRRDRRLPARPVGRRPAVDAGQLLPGHAGAAAADRDLRLPVARPGPPTTC